MMNLRDEPARWVMELRAARVELIQVDFRLGLTISDGADHLKVSIGTPCRLTTGDGRSVPLRPDDAATLAPILSLFNAEVDGLTAGKRGDLVVQFRSGARLEAGPDDSFESWEIGISAGGVGSLLICSPGGNVTRF
jgi:hypothetical protein